MIAHFVTAPFFVKNTGMVVNRGLSLCFHRFFAFYNIINYNRGRRRRPKSDADFLFVCVCLPMSTFSHDKYKIFNKIIRDDIVIK